VLTVPAHVGPPIDPSDLWTSWNLDPAVWLVLFTVGAVYVETWRHGRHGRRSRAQRRLFVAGMLVVAIALVSPLDAMTASLASAHMVQHLLLTTVAAPLLVAGAPVRSFLAGLPRPMRRTVHGWRTTAAGRFGRALLSRPIAASVPHVVALWLWHAPGPYDAALGDHVLHGVEHVSFLATALLSWASILAAGRRRSERPGLAMMTLFGLSLQSGILGLLLTFAPSPWYPSYAATTDDWGLSALADQQLAGVIMWVPAGGVYLAAALLLLSRWIRQPPPASTWPTQRAPAPSRTLT